MSDTIFFVIFLFYNAKKHDDSMAQLKKWDENSTAHRALNECRTCTARKQA